MAIKNKELLEKAFEYALEKNSFSKVSLVKQAEHVCIFGLGKYFEDAFFRQDIEKRFHIDMLCDNNKEKLEILSQDARLKNMTFVLPQELSAYKNVVVIFMLGDPRTAMKQIAPIVGIENCITYNDLILDDIMDAEKSIDFYLQQKQDIFKVYDLLEDEKSKKIYTNILCLRIAPPLAEYSYEELCEKPQYFPKDIMKISNKECVVDCGAYDGDTLEVFSEITKAEFEHYYAFEIDKNNYTLLQEKARKLNEECITCYPYGVWSEDKDILYGTMSSSDSFSIFNNSEVEMAKVVALDNCLKDKKVTLIKMDIEGSEMEALMGGYSIIRKQKPKIAVCVYHRVEDLWKIPLYLKSLCEEYRIYIRHHAEYWVSETVCYAVSQE